MSPVQSSHNHDPSDDPKPDCLVSVVVPEEFTTGSMQEFNLRRGIIKKVDLSAGTVVMQALIPERQYYELTLVIKDWTQGRGKVERQPNLSE